MARRLAFLLAALIYATRSSEVKGQGFDIPLNGREFPVNEFCDSETFSAECDDDEVIVITSAWYGRHKIGRCVDRNYGNLGCKSDVISAVDAVCSGLQKCEFEVDDDNFASVQPCPKDFKSHLLVSYACVKVEKPSRPCRNMIGSSEESRDMRTITANSKSANHVFISSDVTRKTRCGAAEYPWILKAPEGQRITLSMIDFSLNGTTPGFSDASRTPLETGVCLVYASVRDGQPEAGVQRRSTTICGRLRPRMRHVFTSVSNYIELRILQSDVIGPAATVDASKRPRFLLKYEVVGCSDPPVPRGGWAKRLSDNVVAFGCKNRPQHELWRLECELSHWKGHVGNCTSAGVPFLGELVNSGQGLPFGLSVALVVAIAFVISCLILLVGICIIARRNNRKRHLQEMQASMYGQSEAGLQSAQPIAAVDAKSKYQPMKPNQSDNMYTDSDSVSKGGQPTSGVTDLYTLRSDDYGDGYPARSTDYYPTSEHIYEYPTPEKAANSRQGAAPSECAQSLTSGQYFDVDPMASTPAPPIPAPEVPSGARALPVAKAACGHARPCTCTGGVKTQPDII